MAHFHRPRERQRGATLVVALILLVLLSIFAIQAFNASTTNVRVVGNMQTRQEQISAAQSAIEQVISTPDFSVTPTATTVAVIVDNNAATYTATVAKPTCYRVRALKNNELNYAVATDRTCITSGRMNNSGLDTSEAGSSSDDSLCSNTEWQLSSTVTDAATGGSVTVNQGVGVRASTADAATNCS